MPRIFAPNEDYTSTQNYLNFTNGAAAVAATDTDAIAYFTAESYTIDDSKHELTVMDTMTRAQINGISAYRGVALESTDTKAQVIRKIEGAISTKFIDEITVSSLAHDSDVGQTTVTITGDAGAGNAYYYKTAKNTAPAKLYGDKVDSTWKVCTALIFSFEPTATHNKITVVKAVVATGFIIAIGNDDIVTKTGVD